MEFLLINEVIHELTIYREHGPHTQWAMKLLHSPLLYFLFHPSPSIGGGRIQIRRRRRAR